MVWVWFWHGCIILLARSVKEFVHHPQSCQIESITFKLEPLMAAIGFVAALPPAASKRPRLVPPPGASASAPSQACSGGAVADASVQAGSGEASAAQGQASSSSHEWQASAAKGQAKWASWESWGEGSWHEGSWGARSSGDAWWG